MWAATHIPFVSSLVRARLVNDFKNLHAEFGDVVRIGPDEISFSNEAAWQDIYSHRPGQPDVVKDPVWYMGMPLLRIFSPMFCYD